MINTESIKVFPKSLCEYVNIYYDEDNFEIINVTRRNQGGRDQDIWPLLNRNSEKYQVVIDDLQEYLL